MCRLTKTRFGKIIVVILFIPLLSLEGIYGQPEKPRVILMHDIGGDPDDEQSLVRFLAYANEMDIEAITMVDLVRAFVDSTQQDWTRNRHDEILAAYGKAYPNFSKHAEGYPTEEYLQHISYMGNYGLRFSSRPGYPEPFWDWVGEGKTPLGDPKDSPGSNAIVAALEKEDQRPLYIMMWGGAYTLVQALWRYEQKHPGVDYGDRVIIYNIMWQDVTHDYFRDMNKIGKQGRRIFRGTYDGIRNTKPVIIDNWDYDYWYSNSGTSLDSDYEQQQFERAWADEHIRSHGPLGKMYPTAGHKLGTREGDTPALLHVLSATKGLSNISDPSMGGWGGRFVLAEELGPQYFVNSIAGLEYVEEEALKDSFDGYDDVAMVFARWRKDIQNDFRARMDWAISPKYSDANHNPQAVLNRDSSNQMFKVLSRPGEQIELDASLSSDPDGDRLGFEWFQYAEAGTYKGTLLGDFKSGKKITIKIPRDFQRGEEAHIILKVSDDGMPNLVDYKRIIISVE